MPINRIWNRQPRLITFGDIRKGAEQENGRVGKDLDHFRITWRPGYEHLEGIFNEWHPMDGAKRLTDLALLGRTLDECFDAWLDYYANGKLVGRSDGDNILMMWDAEANAWNRTPQPYNEAQWLDKRGRAKFQAVGYIHFLPVSLIQQTGELGTLLWRITSDYEIDRVYNVLSATERLIGYLNDPLRWELSRHDEEIVVTTEQGRKTVTKSLVQLRASNLNQLPISGQPQLTDGSNVYDEDGVLLESGDSEPVNPLDEVMPTDSDIVERFITYCRDTFGDELTAKDISKAIENAYPESLGFVNKLGELNVTRGAAIAAVIAYLMDYKMDSWRSFIVAYPQVVQFEGRVLAVCERVNLGGKVQPAGDEIPFI